MNKDEKRALVLVLESDIEELRRELSNDYPRVVRDAIEETIRRYADDLAHLKDELARPAT